MTEGACREIIERLLGVPGATRRDVDRVKLEVAARHRLKRVPPNSELIRRLRPPERPRLLPILRGKAVRTISGVTVIAVVTEPHPCPHGKCAYCPGGPPYGVPSAYTGREPAIMRAIQNRYDPYLQTMSRISQLRAIGHAVDKAEIIVMGGTFSATPRRYQEGFIQRCLDALAGRDSASLEEAKRNAETGRVRNVGITVETRPDWAREEHIDQMLSMGVTRVELGVQNVYDDIYDRVGRGHRVQDVVEATRLLKDAGLKVAYHMMPGLPGSSFQRDLEGFRMIFEDPGFKPDMIKIYPCLVLRGTRAHEWWRRGEYRPYTDEEAAQLIVEVKKIVPPWVRIMRIQRDIPAQLIEAGVKQGNLRQLVLQRLREGGMRCRCIRCREAGHRWLRDGVKPRPEDIQTRVIRQEAAGGLDIFVSVEDRASDVLIGYIRLRIPSEGAHRPEIAAGEASVVRELHVYGLMVPVGIHEDEAWQHRGYGRLLLSEAERISREDYGQKRIAVTSGLGTKRYYARLGYAPSGPYMAKALT